MQLEKYHGLFKVLKRLRRFTSKNYYQWQEKIREDKKKISPKFRILLCTKSCLYPKYSGKYRGTNIGRYLFESFWTSDILFLLDISLDRREKELRENTCSSIERCQDVPSFIIVAEEDDGIAELAITRIIARYARMGTFCYLTKADLIKRFRWIYCLDSWRVMQIRGSIWKKNRKSRNNSI